tara:strand:+ start:3497 stop:3922 length:426 start_codon:yes stop_codon:yes gene_type:complete
MKQLYKAYILALIISFCSLQIKAQTDISNKIGWSTYDNTWKTMENVGTLILGGTALGIEDTKINDTGLVMYPNPVANILNIHASSEIQKVFMYTVSGQKLKEISNKNTHKISIDVSDVEAGFYSVQIHTLEGNTSRQIIKR